MDGLFFKGMNCLMNCSALIKWQSSVFSAPVTELAQTSNLESNQPMPLWWFGSKNTSCGHLGGTWGVNSECIDPHQGQVAAVPCTNPMRCWAGPHHPWLQSPELHGLMTPGSTAPWEGLAVGWYPSLQAELLMAIKAALMMLSIFPLCCRSLSPVLVLEVFYRTGPCSWHSRCVASHLQSQWVLSVVLLRAQIPF